MGRSVEDALWDDEFAKVQEAVKAWRSAHPRASFADIEDAVDEQMRRMRARLITSVVESSAVADFGGAATEHPVCTACGVPLRAGGKKPRTVRNHRNEAVTFERTHGICPRCGAGIFPPG
jgi:ribosomal protein L34E